MCVFQLCKHRRMVVQWIFKLVFSLRIWAQKETLHEDEAVHWDVADMIGHGEHLQKRDHIVPTVYLDSREQDRVPATSGRSATDAYSATRGHLFPCGPTIRDRIHPWSCFVNRLQNNRVRDTHDSIPKSCCWDSELSPRLRMRNSCLSSEVQPSPFPPDS